MLRLKYSEDKKTPTAKFIVKGDWEMAFLQPFLASFEKTSQRLPQHDQTLIIMINTSNISQALITVWMFP